jgi:Flp pilus assembly protein TadB
MFKKTLNTITGDSEVFEKKFVKLYGKNDFSSEIKTIKRNLLKKYVYLLFVAVAVITVFVIYESSTQVTRLNVSDENEISIMRPLLGETPLRVPMKLEVLTDENEKLEKNITILVNPEESSEEVAVEVDEEQLKAINIEEELQRLITFINRSNFDDRVILPTTLSSGLQLTWHEIQSSRLPVIVMLFFIIGFVIYQKRYAKIKLTEKEARESIIVELPEFLNKLVLLLNAGLVLTSAFDKILENRKSREEEEKSYFYLQLSQIGKSMRETNSSMIGGLKDFAGRSGVRELTRVTNIIADNATKGAELAEKLQGESELLWFTKKKLAEEKGRLAETKMTFPLVILLLVLIMVTTAPALMEM